MRAERECTLRHDPADLLGKLAKVLRRASDEELPAYLTHYQKCNTEFATAAAGAVQAEISARQDLNEREAS